MLVHPIRTRLTRRVAATVARTGDVDVGRRDPEGAET
jgi:hypothetical protein